MGNKPCYPEAAVVNGRQTDGNNQDNCIFINSGCRDPGPWNGENSQGSDFPVYYTLRHCTDIN
jgi:hypothetical protein